MSQPELPHPMPTRSTLFARARESLADALSRAATDGLPGIAHELEAAAEHALEPHDRHALLSAATRLRREAATRVARIAETLAHRALRCLEQLRADGETDEERALALLDDVELEAQILAADLARAVRERAGEVYPRYVARLRHLCDVSWRDDALNPLGARTLAAAAVATVGELADDVRTRAVLRHLALGAYTGPIAEAIVALEQLLRDAGVPEVAAPDETAPASIETREGMSAPAPATAVAPEAVEREAEQPQAAERAAAPPPDHEAGIARLLAATVRADRDAATLGSSPFAARAGGEHLHVLPTLQPVLDIERDAVAFAHAIGAMPYSRQARGEFFGNVRTRLRDCAASPAQVAVVDVVAAIFDYVIDDRRLPEVAKPLVWRLQQPAVALSLLDPAYLGDDPRSLRRLVEHFGAITTAFSEDIARGSELYRRLETVVRAVEIVTSALQARSAVMAQQVEKEYSRAARSVGQLIERVVRERRALEETPGRRNRRDYARRPDHERERQVTERLLAMLGERLDRHEAPESVRDFVVNVWLRHLRTAMLRNGEDSADFRVSLQVVDDLLWSLDGRERRSRRELAQRIPPLIRLMTQGVREIGAKDDEFKSFFDELFLIHLRRMQRRDRERGVSTRVRPPADEASARGDTAPSAGPAPKTESAPPEAARAAARAPAPREAPEAEGAERRLLEILESLDLGDLPRDPVRRDLAPAQACAQIARGDWVEFVARGGERTHLKVAWINRRRTVVLLVRHADRRAMSLRMDELSERFERRAAWIVQ